jgi:ADP-ribose pyrophosphatase YjhB (NUDIX family)
LSGEVNFSKPSEDPGSRFEAENPCMIAKNLYLCKVIAAGYARLTGAGYCLEESVLKRRLTCPHCQKEIPVWDNPKPVVDIIIEMEGGIVLIKRKNPPHGWAIPGGFVEYGESAEAAAAREAREETGLELRDLRQFRVYSDPARDRRVHTISTVFIARGEGSPSAADDAAEIGIFKQDGLPGDLAFDHPQILNDYFSAGRHKSDP